MFYFFEAPVEAACWHGESQHVWFTSWVMWLGANTHSCVIFQDPKQIISCIDFRYITDALTEEEALGEAK